MEQNSHLDPTPGELLFGKSDILAIGSFSPRHMLLSPGAPGRGDQNESRWRVVDLRKDYSAEFFLGGSTLGVAADSAFGAASLPDDAFLSASAAFLYESLR